ncbi:MAG: RNA polymerase sigma factor, partial [Bacteroidaceae bacterium]|nr:RNA polymerase sigma factor [Bacteroidaceae bacterium]
MNTTQIAKLLLAHREALYKYACSLTWDWHKADDLVQDTAVKILLNADKYNP